MRSHENMLPVKENNISTYDPKVEEELYPAFKISDEGCQTELSYLLTRYDIKAEDRKVLRGDSQPQLHALRRYCAVPEEERDAKMLDSFLEEDLAQWVQERTVREDKKEI